MSIVSPEKEQVRWRCLLVSSVALALAGCTTLASMQQMHGSGGSVRTYEVPYTTAFALAVHACQSLNLHIDAQDPAQGYVVAGNGVSFTSWGERIGIYLQRLTDTRTQVRVISQAKVQTNFLAPSWEQEIHVAIQERLDQLRRAHMLP